MHIVVHGRVQGVFFREFVKRKAQVLGITGTAKNTPEGTVDIIAEGEPDALKALIIECGHGPSQAEVKRVEPTEETYTGQFTSFSISYS